MALLVIHAISKALCVFGCMSYWLRLYVHDLKGRLGTPWRMTTILNHSSLMHTDTIQSLDKMQHAYDFTCTAMACWSFINGVGLFSLALKIKTYTAKEKHWGGERVHCERNKLRYVTLIAAVKVRWSIFLRISRAAAPGVSPTTDRAFQRPAGEAQFFKNSPDPTELRGRSTVGWRSHEVR